MFVLYYNNTGYFILFCISIKSIISVRHTVKIMSLCVVLYGLIISRGDLFFVDSVVEGLTSDMCGMSNGYRRTSVG